MDISKLRHLQNVFSTAASGDLTVTYYKEDKIANDPVTGLPDSDSVVYSGYDKRHIITPIDTTANTHRFKFQFQNCTSKINSIGWALRAFEHRENLLDISDMEVTTPTDNLLLIDSDSYLLIDDAGHKLKIG